MIVLFLHSTQRKLNRYFLLGVGEYFKFSRGYTVYQLDQSE